MASRLTAKKRASQPPKSVSHGYGVYLIAKGPKWIRTEVARDRSGCTPRLRLGLAAAFCPIAGPQVRSAGHQSAFYPFYTADHTHFHKYRSSSNNQT